MGSALGKIQVETPRYKVLSEGESYEIREYQPNLVAEVTTIASEKGGRDAGFMILATYLGVTGTPANSKGGGTGEKIAMTAPVLTLDSQSEKIAMTAPVITSEIEEREDDKKLVTMQFVLPSSYTLETIPKPTDPRVAVKEVPSKKFAVVTFKGVADEKLTDQKLQFLRNALQKDGVQITGQHLLARYNPPWCPGFLRTNEVMIPVE